MREIAAGDLQDIHELHSLPETDVYNTLGIPESTESTAILLDDWLAQQAMQPRPSYIFTIRQQSTNTFLGLIAMKMGKPNYKSAEIWYKVHRDHWGKGYATEALSGLLEFGFVSLQLHRIEAGCAVENVASYRVLEKVGMLREGRTRKLLPIRGEWKDNYFYAILEEDFRIR